MPKVTMKVLGGKDLAARLDALGPAAPQLMEKALHAGALKIQNAAKEKSPKRTRTLSRSIVIEVATGSDGKVIATIGPTVEYGKWLEYGTGIFAEGGNGRKTPWVFVSGGKFYTTKGMKARPYMRPAFDENRDAALEEFRRVLKGLIAQSEYRA
jgi:HK97 gp10 family phage protein